MKKVYKFALFSLLIAAIIFTAAVVICGIGCLLFIYCGVWGFVAWAAVIAVASGVAGAITGVRTAKK